MTSHYLHVIHVHGYAIMRSFDLCVVCVCVCVHVCVGCSVISARRSGCTRRSLLTKEG